MARPLDARNRERPAAVTAMADKTPACFGSQKSWVEWLDEAYREALGDGRARSAMNRGQVPDYCADCTLGHEARMTGLGRCAKAIRRAEAEAGLNAMKRGKKPEGALP